MTRVAAPRSLFKKISISLLLIISVICGKSQERHGGIDTSFRNKTSADVRKMLKGIWVLIDDTTVKINITDDSIYYLRQNHNGIPTHNKRADTYELTRTHCGASFVSSITTFYLVEHTMQYGKVIDQCLPIQLLNDERLTLFQSIPQADIYSGALELRYKRAK